jgi:serine protease AprX
MKPDVAAPGVMITAAKSVYPNTPKLHGYYTELSGTSMATPFVAGVAALMLDGNYALTPAQVKTKIMETAEDYGMTGTDMDYGAGRIRALRAVNDSIKGVNSAIGDQWVPTHLRSASSINDTSYYLTEFPVQVTDDNYPLACALIMYDWSGYTDGIDLSLYIINPMGSTETYDYGSYRQGTAVTAPSNLGKYNATIDRYIGSGRYSLDCSYK